MSERSLTTFKVQEYTHVQMASSAIVSLWYLHLMIKEQGAEDMPGTKNLTPFYLRLLVDES